MNRALVAARATANGYTGRHPGSVGIDLSRRIDKVPSRTAKPGRRSRRAGRDKGQDLWRTVSPYYKTAATIDTRWANTLSSTRSA